MSIPSVSKLTEVVKEANEITNQVSDNQLVFISEFYVPASVEEILNDNSQNQTILVEAPNAN